MKRRTIFLLCLLPALALAQRQQGWRRSAWTYHDDEKLHRSFAVSGPGRKLIVNNVSGYVHVTGGSAGIEVSVARHTDAESNAALLRARQEVTLDMSQDGNAVRLYVDGPFRHGGDSGDRAGYEVFFDYDLQVPADTAVDLHTLNGGNIVLKNTTGDYAIHGLNGGIQMEGVSGSGSVHTLNGPVKVAFAANPSKPSQFHSLNGSIDIYFRPGLNADLEFHTLNGGVYADFDVTVGSGRSIGRRITEGRVGQGGPLLQFHTLNGSIRLHSKPPSIVSSFGGRP